MITVSSTTDPALRVARYVTAATVDGAAGFAKEILRQRRKWHHGGKRWDQWTVAGSLSPYSLPRILVAGHIGDD